MGVVAEADVVARRQTTVSPAAAILLANCTSPRALGFGVIGAIHSTPDYELTQAWAAAFLHAGFGGVRYFVSHDPSQKLVGVALFGSAPLATAVRTGPIPPEVISDAERRFGIKVRPLP